MLFKPGSLSDIKQYQSERVPAALLVVETQNFPSNTTHSDTLNVIHINPLTPKLNLSAQRCLTKFFTGDFAS
jgi:hypothetical protein